jgi:N-methylhydantoinase A/oxoprolinase/acetone carboxylase beta subunit
VAIEPPGLNPEPQEASGEPVAARTGGRPACWNPAEGYVDTPVYDLERIRPGNTIAGPALIEARETTYVIEPGWRYCMDAWRNGILDQLVGR